LRESSVQTLTTVQKGTSQQDVSLLNLEDKLEGRSLNLGSQNESTKLLEPKEAVRSVARLPQGLVKVQSIDRFSKQRLAKRVEASLQSVLLRQEAFDFLEAGKTSPVSQSLENRESQQQFDLVRMKRDLSQVF
jgi:hypothetical protein